MDNLFKIIDLSECKMVDVLEYENKSNLKSIKRFPIYLVDGKRMIFKPLSKTKPLTTPFFAFSEVYWSYIFNKYFDSNTPRYFLATSNIALEDKYYSKGVIVEPIISKNENLVNLYEFFFKHPQNDINIKEYINYCMTDYDYTHILRSNFIKNNLPIGEQLAYQILLSILRMDQNFHYENINLINEKNVAPPIDFEFSTPFLYPDKLNEHQKYYNRYKDSIQIPDKDDESDILGRFIEQQTGIKIANKIRSNIEVIIEMYPHIVYKFIDILEKLIIDLPNLKLNDPDNFIDDLNSDYWEIGDALYKKKNHAQYLLLKDQIHLEEIDKEKVFEMISNEILEFCNQFCMVLKIYLVCYENGIKDLEYLTYDKIYTSLNINTNDKIIGADLSSKQMIFTKK